MMFIVVQVLFVYILILQACCQINIEQEITGLILSKKKITKYTNPETTVLEFKQKLKTFCVLIKKTDCAKYLTKEIKDPDV